MSRKDCSFGFSCPPDTRCFLFRNGYKCPWEPCHISSQTECNNGIRCYSDYDKCDGDDECEDGTDEMGCPAKAGDTPVSVILPAVMSAFAIFMIMICVVIVICRRRQQMVNTSAPVFILQPQGQQGNQNFNIQMSQPIYHHPGSTPQSFQPVPQSQPNYQPVPQSQPNYQPVPQSQPNYQPVLQSQQNYQPNTLIDNTQVQNPSAPPAYNEVYYPSGAPRRP